ncbi:MAG: hypothetical protein KDA27_24990, partial [Candidatus Eisenbacteria bacterium]|nr:hypothetical protein [Candidatus Eisenbacteria bacterium]
DRWALGPASTVALDGLLAFSGAGAILRIADVTDASSPTILSEHEFPSAVFDVVVDGDVAYVATAYSGLFILDVGDPSAPFALSSLPNANVIVDLAKSGSIVFIVDGVGVRLIDVTDPGNPSELSRFDTPNSAQHVTAQDNLAYVSDLFGGLRIYDVSNPTSPFLTGELLFFPLGLPEATVVRDGIAYVGDWQGLFIVDVSDPSNPTQLSFLTAGISFDLALEGNLLYSADGYGVAIFDVSDPAHPTQVGGVSGIHFGDIYYNVKIEGDRLYLADSIEGLRIFDLSTPSLPAEIGLIDARGFSYGVEVQDNHAFIANGNRGLRIVDLGAVGGPAEIGSVDTPWVAFAVDMDETHAFVADGLSGLRVIDITNPGAPFETGHLTNADWMYDVAVEGNIAVVANGNIGTGIIDVSDPAAPILRAQFDSNLPCGASSEPAFVKGVDIQGTLVFAAEEDCGLRILDISDPDNPVTVGTLDTPGQAIKVVVEGDIAYLADNPGLKIIDVSNPSNPFLRSAVGGICIDVDVAEGYAYMSGDAQGVKIVDVHDPNSPVVVGSYDTGYFARGIDAVGSVAYVADGMDGVYLIRNDLAPADVLGEGTGGHEVASNQMLLGNSPNPFTESTQIRFVLREASDVRLAVVDVAGRRVALRQFASMPPGTHEITLEGLGLPSGAYRYVLQAGSRVESGRMLRVR